MWKVVEENAREGHRERGVYKGTGEGKVQKKAKTVEKKGEVEEN